MSRWGWVAVSVAGVAYWTALTMLRPLVGPYVVAIGASEVTASVVLGVFALAPFLLAVPTGRLADRVGARRLLVGGATVMLLSAGGFLAGTVPAALAGQVLAGLGTLAVWIGLQTIATLPQAGDSRDRRNGRLATFALFVALGQLLGPASGGVLSDLGGYQLGFAGFAALSALILLACVPLRRAGVGAPAPTSQQQRGPAFVEAGRMLRRPVVGATVGLSFLALVLIDLRTAFHPLYLDAQGYGATTIGLLLSISGVFALLARPVFPWLVRRLPAEAVAGGSIALGALAVGAVALAGDLLVLGLLAAISGAALGLAQPLTLSLTADYTAASERGLALGLRTGANKGAQLANPLLMGALIAFSGLGGAFVAMTALALGASGAVVTGLRRGRRSAQAWQPAGSGP